MIFFTSDTHFGHANIINLSDRPFEDVDHMNSEIVRRWNEVVSPEDIVFHLGDVALGRIDDSLPIVNRLNGWKILVNGNHDRPFMNQGKPRFDEWYARYFEVFKEQVLGNLKITLSNDERVILSHFPYDGDSHDGDRFTDARAVDEGSILIHGHTHLNQIISRSNKGTLQVHVGQDAWDYTPVSEEQVINAIEAFKVTA